MATIHFLNVKNGDCSVIEHNSGRITVIDVCNATPSDLWMESNFTTFAAKETGIRGNHHQKQHPVNPISYMQERCINRIFRYIQTHPDMDHMDGIASLFGTFNPWNFWDTDNKKELQKSSWEGSPYSKKDWQFYQNLRNMKPQHDPKRLTLLSGACGKLYNIGSDGSSGGDGLHILAPTQDLVNIANKANDDYNDCSYVLLYCTGGNRIIFGGDSHDRTWEYILKMHKKRVANIDLLIAPHHGRKSGRSYRFLDILNPTLTFFGNAQSQHLAYNAWRSRGLCFVTNNQANCMLVDAGVSPMVLYVTYEQFAKRVNPNTFYDRKRQAWCVGPIKRTI